MKKHLFLFSAFFCIFFGIKTSAQVSFNVWFGTPDTALVPERMCTGTTLSFGANTVYTGYSTGETAQITIDWGDGTAGVSQTVTFDCGGPGSGCTFTPNVFSHPYVTSGNYSLVLTYADTHGNTDVRTLPMEVTHNCGGFSTAVHLDIDNNGSGDVLLSNVMMDYAGATSGTSTFLLAGYATNMAVNDAPYTLSVNAGWLAAHNYVMAPSSPTVQTVNISPTSPWTNLPPFLVQCDPSNPASQTDLAINYMYGSLFRAGQSTGYIRIYVSNMSCSGTQNADLDITFDPLLSYSSSDIPGATVTGNVVHANLNVGAGVEYVIYFSAPGGTPVPTPLAFSADITSTGVTDFDLSNNSATCVSEVKNSWDPNDKSVNKPQIVSPNVRDEYTYVIRFQNMGNDEAFDITIKDTLDTDLDLSTFSLLELSHNGFLGIDPATRIATFNFPGIHLPAESQNEPASHGYVIYKIKENVSAPVGTEIKNTAYIYFDQNPAVVTNTTFNINQTSGVNEAVAENFSVYPVPANGNVVIASKGNAPIMSVKLVDVTGKTVTDINAGGQTTYNLNIQHIAPGAYNLVITTGAGVVNKKIVVQ